MARYKFPDDIQRPGRLYLQVAGAEGQDGLKPEAPKDFPLGLVVAFVLLFVLVALLGAALGGGG